MAKKAAIILLISILLGGIIIYKNSSKEKDNTKQTNNGLAIMVYDEEKSDYVISDSYPVGSYTLNMDKTTCTSSKDGITYDLTTGTVKYPANISNKCTLYFDKISELFLEIELVKNASCSADIYINDILYNIENIKKIKYEKGDVISVENVGYDCTLEFGSEQKFLYYGKKYTLDGKETKLVCYGNMEICSGIVD